MAFLSVDKFLESCNHYTNALWQVDVPHGISWKPAAMRAFPFLDINFTPALANAIVPLPNFFPKDIGHTLAKS